jgi:hypothetical protein
MSDETLTIVEFVAYLNCLSDSEFTEEMHKCFDYEDFDLTNEELIEAIVDRANKILTLMRAERKTVAVDDVVDWLLNDKPLPDHTSASVQDTDM